jgi:membrane protein
MPQSWRQQIEQLLSNSPLRPLWSLHGLSLREIAVETWRAMGQDHIFGHAAELGYYFLFSLFPTLFCAGSILGFVLRSTHQFPARLLQVLMLVIPADAFKIVMTAFNDAAHAASSGKITFGSIVAVWSASIGVSAIQDTLNAIFRIEEPRSYLAARASAIVLTVVLSLLGVLCLACMFGGDLGAAVIYHQVPDHALGRLYASSIRIMTWIGAACILALSFSLLYYWAPGRRPRCWRWLTPGIGFGLLGWLLASLGFRAYLHVFSSYSATYGSLGAGIILLTWFYLSGLMFLIGAEIDMVIEGGGHQAPPQFQDFDAESDMRKSA